MSDDDLLSELADSIESEAGEVDVRYRDPLTGKSVEYVPLTERARAFFAEHFSVTAGPARVLVPNVPKVERQFESAGLKLAH